MKKLLWLALLFPTVTLAQGVKRSSGGGVTTMAAVGSSPNANGASISGSTLTLQPADGSNPGVVTTSAQTFAGAKTFSSVPVAAGLTATAAASITLTSNRASGATPAFILNTANSFGGNTSFEYRDNGTAKVWWDGTGNFTITGAYLGGNVQTTGYVSQYAGNASLSVRGNRDAADSGTDVIIKSAATRSAGNLATITNNTTDQVAFDFGGGIQLNLAGNSKPTCNSGNRGKIWYTRGGAGVADAWEKCHKDAADSYAWVAF